MPRGGYRAEFLEIRRLYIHEMLSDGESAEAIVRAMAMDPGQVQLIGMTDSPLRTRAAIVASEERARG